MLDYLKLFPSYLIILTAIFMIIPTIAAIFLRYCVYKHLLNLGKKVKRLVGDDGIRGQQPKIVENLERRYRQASITLEQVNTSALIDEFYSQESLNFLGLRLPCEQWDYFCNLFPNLLLAFGLLGTFIGITLNLYNLTDTINQIDVSDISVLIEKLEIPLQSMGIAFLTSLIALFCSSLITIVNLRCNTNVVKYLLLSTLEDYLDNVFQGTIEGHTRLDKAIDRMVEQQSEFLTRFHERVGLVLENSLGRAADRIIDENAKAHRLAEQVYERFLESSGTISQGANTFKFAVSKLEKQIQTFSDTVPKIEESVKTLNDGAIIFEGSAQKIKDSKFSDNLERLTNSLSETQIDFSQSTKELTEHLPKILASYQQATDLAQQVYHAFHKSSDKLQDSAVVFLEASEIIKQSKFADQLVSATADLVLAHNQFAESTLGLKDSTQTIEQALINLQNSGEKMVTFTDKVSQLNEQSGQMIYLTQRRLNNEENGLNQIQDKIHKLVNNLQQFSNGLEKNISTYEKVFRGNILSLTKIGDRLAETLNQKLSIYQQETSKISEQITKTLLTLEASNPNFLQGLNQELANYQEENLKISTEIVDILKCLNYQLNGQTYYYSENVNNNKNGQGK